MTTPVFQAPMLLWLLLVMAGWLVIVAYFIHKFISSRYIKYIYIFVGTQVMIVTIKLNVDYKLYVNKERDTIFFVQYLIIYMCIYAH